MPPISKRRIRDIGRALRQETQTPADLSDLNVYRLAHTPVMDTLISTIKQKLPKPQLIQATQYHKKAKLRITF